MIYSIATTRLAARASQEQNSGEADAKTRPEGACATNTTAAAHAPQAPERFMPWRTAWPASARRDWLRRTTARPRRRDWLDRTTAGRKKSSKQTENYARRSSEALAIWIPFLSPWAHPVCRVRRDPRTFLDCPPSQKGICSGRAVAWARGAGRR